MSGSALSASKTALFALICSNLRQNPWILSEILSGLSLALVAAKWARTGALTGNLEVFYQLAADSVGELCLCGNSG
jgi:hypothetical protein